MENFGKKYNNNAEYLAELGITMAWLTSCLQRTMLADFLLDYDPYDLFDLGEFDQKGGIRYQIRN